MEVGERLLEEKEENHVKEEDERRRLRNVLYNERWQNRIVWENR